MAKKLVSAVLDNNAWNDIVVRDKSAQMLQRLQQGVARGTVDVLVPLAVIEETTAFATTDGVETRRRLAYMRAFGHGRLLRGLSELAHMEARGESTAGHIFMPEVEATALFAMALAASDNHGIFIAPADGKTYRASDIVESTKTAERDRARSTDKGAEAEIVSVWKSEQSGTPQDSPLRTDDLGLTADATLGLTADATFEEVLRTYGEKMV